MKTNEIVLRILLRGSPTNEDYVATLKSVPVLAEFSAGILLGRTPTNAELFCIITHAAAYRRQAWAKLLEQQPRNDEIIQVIEEIYDLHEEAWGQLLKQSPTNSELIRIVNRVAMLEVPAWQLLAQRSLTEAELLVIYDDHCKANESTIKTAVANALIRIDCQNTTLVRIIRNEEGLREMAAELLLQRTPLSEELREVVWFMNPTVREKICELLMQGEPSQADLECVARCSGGAGGDEAAQRLLDRQYENGIKEASACNAVLKRPAFAHIAVKRLLTDIDQGCSDENMRAGALRNLYSDLVRKAVSDDLQREVARKFLAATKEDHSGRSWQREISEVITKHPSLEKTGASASAASPTHRRGRRTKAAL